MAQSSSSLVGFLLFSALPDAVPKPKVQCRAMRTKAAHVVRKHMRALFRTVRAASQQDMDGIHDLRVASRRTRVALRELRRAFPKSTYRMVYDPMREITRQLGKARELDVSISLMVQRRNSLKGSARAAANLTLRHMRGLRRAASKGVTTACGILTDQRIRTLLKQLVRDAKPGNRCLVERAIRSITRQREKLCLAYRAWLGHRGETELHNIRIRLKKLRYTCELYEELFGKALKTYVRSLKKLQEVLGRWNDCRVLRDYVADARRKYAEHESASHGFVELLRLFEDEMEELQLQVEKVAAVALSTNDKFSPDTLAHPKKSCDECPFVPTSSTS
ncbi:MAG TPA: CHAD domain-containing protein [Candidatus Hydrogenedentes bacterium]|nr:CHAD domain-containing protein [Candidatus Hydrogenedentota bacterium]HOL75847.1 CHAD domain-containing protein [Candidatus Hydrogenedentota bacterium]HPO86348.1 CHAD domain-containing protein [Candidatus Hydrogenedentota bacterium]